MKTSCGGHWALWYCGIGQVFLQYFHNYNLEMRYSPNLLDGIKNYPSSPQTFSEPFPVSDWTFPMKLSSHGNGKLQYMYLVSLS